MTMPALVAHKEGDGQLPGSAQNAGQSLRRGQAYALEQMGLSL
jgi:hypothetical protein